MAPATGGSRCISSVIAFVLLLPMSTGGRAAVEAGQAQQRGRIALVVTSAPLYLVEDEKRVPLTIAPQGTVLTLLGQCTDWCKVRWQDSQWGMRTGYVKLKDVSVDAAFTVARSAAAPDAASGVHRPPLAPPVLQPLKATPIAARAGRLPAAATHDLAAMLGAAKPAPPPPSSPQRAPSPAPAAAAASPPPAAAAAAPAFSSSVAVIARMPAPPPPVAALTDREKSNALRRGATLYGGMSGVQLVGSLQNFMNALGALSNPHARRDGEIGFTLRVYSPKTWLEQLASDAAAENRLFASADVTEEMVEPVLRVIVYPDTPTPLTRAGAAAGSPVRRVVMRDKGEQMVLEPVAQETFATPAATGEAYQGVIAKFPLSGVRELRQRFGNDEILIVVNGPGQGETAFAVTRKQFDDLE
jgi:hypothetical protein